MAMATTGGKKTRSIKKTKKLRLFKKKLMFKVKSPKVIISIKKLVGRDLERRGSHVTKSNPRLLYTRIFAQAGV
jgi:hypothetical protein